MTGPTRKWPVLFSAASLTPKGLLLRAVIIAVLYLLGRAAGLREYTAILSGTAPTGNLADLFPIFLGAVCVLLHFAFVLAAPILILAAGLLGLFCSIGRRLQPSGASESSSP